MRKLSYLEKKISGYCHFSSLNVMNAPLGGDDSPGNSVLLKLEWKIL